MNTTDTFADLRASQHNIALCKLHDARATYANATSKRAKRAAAEDIEFWGSRAAMLANGTGWA